MWKTLLEVEGSDIKKVLQPTLTPVRAERGLDSRYTLFNLKTTRIPGSYHMYRLLNDLLMFGLVISCFNDQLWDSSLKEWVLILNESTLIFSSNSGGQ